MGKQPDKEALGGKEAERATLQEQYELVEKSLDYTGLVVAAVLLNYYTITVQKEQLLMLLNGETPPEQDLFPMQLSSAVMMLASTSFFAGLSHDALSDPPADILLEQGLEFNNLVNLLVFAAAAIRILNLFVAQEARQNAQGEETPLEALEEEELELEDSTI